MMMLCLLLDLLFKVSSASQAKLRVDFLIHSTSLEVLAHVYYLLFELLSGCGVLALNDLGLFKV
jgi:hypothetical protein